MDYCSTGKSACALQMPSKKERIFSESEFPYLERGIIMEVEELFANLLNCGTSDWACLKGCDVDIREIAKEIAENEGRMPDLEDILDAIFRQGIGMMKMAVEDKIEELELEFKALSKKDNEEMREVMEKIKVLNPYKDLTYDVNYLASSMSIINNNEIYEEYFADTIDEIENMTGYNIDR